MLFYKFYECLERDKPTAPVRVDHLIGIVRNYHHGVGELRFKSLPDFEGAQLGNFLWLDEDRTSPYEESFNDAVVFLNDRIKNDLPLARLVVAKELMHVFDEPSQRTDTRQKFEQLLEQIQSSPMAIDASEPYAADRNALWKSLVCLVPPWVRETHKAQWSSKTVTATALANVFCLPESIVDPVMGDYYDTAFERLVSSRSS